MNGQNAIVILVDRLGAGYLGPYGNTWVETPAFNRLASQSLLWEHMIGTAPTLAGTYRTIRTGLHPLALDTHGPRNLCERLQQSGIRTALLTDEPQLGQVFPADAFDERIEYQTEDAHGAAPSLEQTQLCRLFVTGLDWLSHPREPFCLFLHSRGMAGPWDAPREFRERFADEDDPPVPDFIDPPSRSLGQDADPDEILGITQAYAGQVALLDMCLEMLLDMLAEREHLENSLLVMTSPRGYPLGEHGHVGASGDLLHEELLHVPLLIRRPDQRYAMERCQTLVEPADLHATVAEWFQLQSESSAAAAAASLLAPFSSGPNLRHECVVSVRDRARSIRTPAWFLRQSPEQTLELYAKPDDRWEVNEVADRCVPIVEELAGRLAEFESLARENRLAELPVLPEHLLRRAD